MSQTLVQSKNTNQRENFCKLLTWWKKPNEVNDLELLRRIMKNVDSSRSAIPKLQALANQRLSFGEKEVQ